MSDEKLKELMKEMREVLDRADALLLPQTSSEEPQEEKAEVTLRQLQTVAAELIKDGKKDAVVAALEVFGAKKFSALAEADYDKMMVALGDLS